MIIDYNDFKQYLNSKIFEDTYKDLLEKLAKYPERYIGLFRPTKPKTKLIQNITQSNEIKFGDALEFIFERYFERIGFVILPKTYYLDGKTLKIDQLIQKSNTIYLIEQKIRDDHDSTKKVGQFDNFENKYHAVKTQHETLTVIPIMWFIDDGLNKNQNYYKQRMEDMRIDFECNPYLYYGDEIFCNLDDLINNNIWQEITNHLRQWKIELPDMPEVNFESDCNAIFEEIKDIPITNYRKLFSNKEIIEEIFPIIFPTGTMLNNLRDYFLCKNLPIYTNISNKITEILNTQYNR
jgi:hypothetical protein